MRGEPVRNMDAGEVSVREVWMQKKLAWWKYGCKHAKS
jgi:hypothetical protein